MYFKKPINVNESFHYGLYPNFEWKTEQYWLGNQLLLYTLFHFLPRSDGKTEYQETGFLTSQTIRKITPGLIEDFSIPELMNGEQTIYHKLPYFVSNPSLRKVSTPDDMCSRNDLIYKIGFRNFQYYVESGLPYQVKCSTCHPTILGLPTFFYLYPERDFNIEFSKLDIRKREVSADPNYCNNNDNKCKQHPRVAPLQEFLMNIFEGLTAENTVGSQYISRWSGEQSTTNEYRELQGVPDGELFITRPDKLGKTFKNGFTTQCAMEIDSSNIVGSNVFVNLDAIVPADSFGVDQTRSMFKYADYDELDGPLKVPIYKDLNKNIEMFINWGNWSCCSACCCPSSLCGYERQTATDCENVYSSKSRTGLLSVRKIYLDKKSAFDALLNIPPYRTEGVPMFSTILKIPDFANYLRDFSYLRNSFLQKNSISNLKSGLFIETESCKNDIQKKECTEWAKCHGIPLTGVVDSDLENEVDTCQTLDFTDVLVGKQSIKVGAILEENFRIRIDPEVYDMDQTAIEWRINLRKPKMFKPDVNCQIQGIVMRRNEILVIGTRSFKTKIEMIVNGKSKILISFRDKNHRTSVENIYWSVFYWSLAILLFFVLLAKFVFYVQHEKLERVRKTLKIRKQMTEK